MTASIGGSLRRLQPPEWAALAFNLLFLAWIIVRPLSAFAFKGVADVFEAAGPMLAAAWCLGWGRRAHGPRLPVICLALGTLSWGIGQAVWTWYEIILRRDCPFPSWADAGYLGAYPFLLAGILLLPRRPLAPALRGRVVLDGLMTMTGMVTFSWYFVLGPTLMQGGGTLLGKVLGAAYPLSDLVLLFCLLALAAHSGSSARRETRLISLGLVSIIVADTVFAYKTLHNTYHTGGWSDLCWPLGYMLVGAGGCALARAGAAGEAMPEAWAEQNPILWRSLGPYALVPAVGALLAYTFWKRGDEALESGVWLGSALLIGLLLLRQVFAILENGKLYRFLQEAYRELEIKNRSLAAANARLEGLATTDGLTGLKNHRAFYERLQAEWSRCAAAGGTLALVLLDVDHFKRYNDAYGHPAGDTVLKAVARVLEENCRDEDLAARYGGEEFVVILPQTGADAAAVLAERLRAAIAAQAGVRRPVTASFGVAASSSTTGGPEVLIAAADRALYSSKAGGRDRVTFAADWENASHGALPAGRLAA